MNQAGQDRRRDQAALSTVGGVDIHLSGDFNGEDPDPASDKARDMVINVLTGVYTGLRSCLPQ